MKLLPFCVCQWIIALVCACSPASAQDSTNSAGKIRVLVITGGHDFEKEPFLKLFKDNAGIAYTAVEHPRAHALWAAKAAGQFDVFVFYDMHQEISEEAKADLVARLQEGTGLVVLHHAIADYQAWPEYARIIGARYYLEKAVVNGQEKPRSVYQHDVEFTVHVADPQHPVTRGVRDFPIHDETYNLFDVARDCHPLLTTEEPLSNRVIAWAKTYGRARVVYLQSGHDHFAYENPNYRKILAQAIQWTAKRD